MSEPAPAGRAEIGWVAAHRHANWGEGGERQGRGVRGVSARVEGRGGARRKGGICDDDGGGGCLRREVKKDGGQGGGGGRMRREGDDEGRGVCRKTR